MENTGETPLKLLVEILSYVPFLGFYHTFPWYFIIYIPWILSYLSLEVILSFLEILSHISLAGQLPDNGVMGALVRGSRGVWYCQEHLPPRHLPVDFESIWHLPLYFESKGHLPLPSWTLLTVLSGSPGGLPFSVIIVSILKFQLTVDILADQGPNCPIHSLLPRECIGKYCPRNSISGYTP